jgi:putative endonuclease
MQKDPAPDPMSQTDGRRAEALAGDFLQRQGLVLIEKNWHSRFGEIDLVLLEGKTIVFVEVRLRTNTRFGSPGESIHGRKRSRLLAAARQYLARHPRAVCRFDAVLLRRLDPPDFEWIRDAISE